MGVQKNLASLLQGIKVIPVITIDDVDQAVPLAEALVGGGVRMLEVTLRTPVALQAIEKIAKSVPDAILGAGTILNGVDMRNASDAGAKFFVSPGCTDQLLKASADTDIPLLPGASTASEVMSLLSVGFNLLKFFPAEAAGGMPMLKSLSAPLPAAKFCPTGGVSEANARAYLNLPNVMCVGGSWLTPKAAMDQRDWGAIRKLAEATEAL